MTPSLDDLLAVLDASATPELRSLVTTELDSPQSELSRAVEAVEDWTRKQLNPLAPSPDVTAVSLPPESGTWRIDADRRVAALLGKGTGRRGHAELARLLIDEIGVASTEADYGRLLQTLDDPNSELSQLVRGFEQWAAHSLKRP